MSLDGANVCIGSGDAFTSCAIFLDSGSYTMDNSTTATAAALDRRILFCGSGGTRLRVSLPEKLRAAASRARVAVRVCVEKGEVGAGGEATFLLVDGL